MAINDEFLDKVKSQFILYCGDIYKRNINGKDELVEKDVLLQYDTVLNRFIREQDIGYATAFADAVYHGDFREIEMTERVLEDHYLYTEVPYIDGVLYIDKRSLYEVKNSRGRK